MHATNGILFNHESPRRGPTFVTRKITIAVAKIKRGLQKCIYLGNLDAKRDWGHARDYVEGMWRMLQAETPDDYVLATNETHPVREFIEKAFACVDINVTWQGETGTVDEVGVNSATGEVIVRVDPKYFRPTEVDLLIGDPTKSKTKLGWVPKYDLAGLVKEMVQSDLNRIKKEQILHEAGYRLNNQFE
jgi:GDPmannose 4,6-dehydratase